MRIAASLVLSAGYAVGLAGCDVLFKLQDVHAPPDVIEDSAEPDAVPIPPQQCQFPSGWNVSQFGAGTFYTIDAAVSVAVFETNDKIYATLPGATATTAELFPTLTGLKSPRLSPDGMQLFLHSSKPCCQIVVSQLQGTMWSTPTPITIKNLSIGADELPGTPTAGIGAKRRMFISVSGTDMFWELVEETDGWEVVYNYKDVDLGFVQIQDANLAPDGYRLFFGGVRTTGTGERVWAVDRSDLTKPFEGANIVELHNSMQNLSGVRSPYVSPDCQSLWFSFGTSGTEMIRRGTPAP